MSPTRFGGATAEPGRGPSRRGVLRGAAAVGALAATGSALGGCTTTDANAAAQPNPAYYPSSYEKIVDASRREKKLLIYSNTSRTNWQPIFDAFTAHYPWLADIRATNLGSSAVYERPSAPLTERSHNASPTAHGRRCSGRAYEDPRGGAAARAVAPRAAAREGGSGQAGGRGVERLPGAGRGLGAVVVLGVLHGQPAGEAALAQGPQQSGQTVVARAQRAAAGGSGELDAPGDRGVDADRFDDVDAFSLQVEGVEDQPAAGAQGGGEGSGVLGRVPQGCRPAALRLQQERAVVGADLVGQPLHRPFGPEALNVPEAGEEHPASGRA